MLENKNQNCSLTDFTKNKKAVFIVHYGDRGFKLSGSSLEKLVKEQGGHNFTCVLSERYELNTNSINYNCNNGNIINGSGKKSEITTKENGDNLEAEKINDNKDNIIQNNKDNSKEVLTETNKNEEGKEKKSKKYSDEMKNKFKNILKYKIQKLGGEIIEEEKDMFQADIFLTDFYDENDTNSLIQINVILKLNKLNGETKILQ